MTDAQQLSEFICRREAEKKKITLVEYFWNEPYWGKIYRKHIIAAHSLLKIYSLQIIFQALKDKRGSWITSLRCRQLHDLCREFSQKEEQVKNKIEESVEIKRVDTTVLPPTIKKQSKFDKLK